MALTQVTSAGVKDGELVNADLHSSAAIALSKLGTSGTAGSGNFLRGDGAWTAIDLSGKLSLTGGTLTGNVLHNDNVKALFGTGSDLQIYHSGTYSYIKNSHANGLWIASDLVSLTNAAVTENLAKFTANGAVELYYDNVKKFGTRSNGVDIIGNTYIADNDKISFGGSSDLLIYHDGSSSNLIKSAAGQTLGIHAATTWFRNAANSETTAKFIENGAVELYHDNVRKFWTTSTGVKLDSWISLQSTGGIRSDSAVVIEDLGGNEWRAKFHDNDKCEFAYDNNKKLETTSNGIAVTGQVDCTGGGVLVDDSYSFSAGTDGDLVMYHNGSHGYIKNITGTLHAWADHWKVISVDHNETMITATEHGAVELYYDNSKKFATYSGGIRFWGNLICDDDNKVQLGTSQDLQIYHSSSSGNNIYQGDSHQFWNAAGNEPLAKFAANGAVELYYDDSKKFETTSGGGKLTGDWFMTSGGYLSFPDNVQAIFGTGDDLRIFHDGSHSRIHQDGTGYLIFQVDDFLVKNEANNKNLAHFLNGAGCLLYYDNSKKFETTSSGVTITGDLTFADSAAHDIQLQGGKIYGETAATGEFILQSTSGNSNHSKIVIGENYGSDNGGITFYGAGSSSADVKMRIRGNTDNIEIPDDHKLTFGDGADLEIFHDPNINVINAAAGNLEIRHGAEKMIACAVDGQVELYYDGSKTLQTGVNQLTLYGNSSECNLEFKTSDNTRRAFIGSTNGNNITFYNAASEKIWHYANNAQIELYYDNTKTFQTSSIGNVLYKSQRISGTGDTWADGDGGIKITGNTSAGRGNISMYYDSNILEVGAGVTQKNRTEWHGHGGSNAIIDVVGTNERFKVHSSGATVTGDLTVTGSISGAGKVLQVVSSYKSDSWSASTNNNFHYVTGLNPSLTPSSSSSKILVVISLGCLGMNNHTAGVRIERIVSGNGVWIANGAGSGNRPQFAFGTNSRDSYHQGGISYSYLDSPGTTSAVSYKIYAGGHSNGTVCVNRTNGDQNDANLESGRRSSSIHLMEIAA